VLHLTHLFNDFLQLSYFPASWKENNEKALPKPGKDPKFLQTLKPIGLLSTTGRLFEKVFKNIVQRHLEINNLLNESQFGFRARHET
jgi:hypothetical protein